MPERLGVGWTGRRLIKRGSPLGEERLEPRAREEQQHARWLVAHDDVFVRDVLGGVDEVAGASGEGLLAAGERDLALQQVEPFRFSVVNV